MKKLRNTCYVLILALLCCKKPYDPPETSTNNSYLVVEGVANSSLDSTVIKISRTVKIKDSVSFKPVLGATVTLEAEHGPVYSPLVDINNNGHYFTYAFGLPTTQRYRLRIKTVEGAEYLSDFVDEKATPPIDSVGYTVENNILNLYVNAHDPANKTRYYRWDYEETWSFHAKYPSVFALDEATNTILPRNTNHLVFSCFAGAVSPNIILTSTEKLQKDLVYQSPLTHIPLTSEKLETRYSVLVKQYAVTQEAFNFYQNIKKNTEQLGSIFDAQPTQISGNIHNVSNPKEPVVGYFSVTNVQTKRIYIDHNSLPGDVGTIYPYDCVQDSALFMNKQGFNDAQNILVNPPVNYIPTVGIYVSGGLIGYMYSTRICADCTLRGTTQAPPFWNPGF
jgi:hypothetical protein